MPSLTKTKYMYCICCI